MGRAWRCLICLFCRYATVERLVRAMRVVVVYESPQPAANAGRIAILGRIEAVHPLFEDPEPPLDVVPSAVLNLTAQSQSDQSGPVPQAIDQQFRF